MNLSLLDDHIKHSRWAALAIVPRKPMSFFGLGRDKNRAQAL
jgi:hypothetical protein